MSRLFVNNLPKNTTAKELRELFEVKGIVTDCALKYAKDGAFRRFAFVGYKTAEEAIAAQAYFNKTYVKSSKIQVDFAVDLGDKRPKAWSKHSKTTPESDKSAGNKEKFAQKQGQKEDIETALLGELKGDKEFQEFMSAFDTKNRQVWKNEIGTGALQPLEDVQMGDDFSKDDDSESDSSSQEETPKKETKMSDLEFLKSKMTLVDSDDEEEEEKSASNESDKSACTKTHKEQTEKSANTKTQEEVTEAPTSSKTEKETIDKYVLKIKGLPATVKESALREFFRPIKVKVNLPKNKNKLSIGIAFVQCRTEEDLNAALVKNKTFIGKKKVFLSRVMETKQEEEKLVEKAKPWEQKEAALETEESIAESGRLFVRNLSYECTEGTLQELFSKYGPLAEIDVPVDSMTKRIKGFAHITYLIPEHAVKAFAELDHRGFMGRLMHILPGKDRAESYVSKEKSSYKKQKDAKMKALAKSDHNWNTLFLSADAVARAMATKYGTDKSVILDDSGKGSLGVRMALGETQLVHETRKFLLENGIALDSFSQADGQRSKTVILVKDLKPEMSSEQLKEIFSKYGTVNRVLLPPHGSTAIVEFQESSEARRAFTKTAYRTLNGQPMYLEWAPMTVFGNDSSKTGESALTVAEGPAGIEKSGTEDQTIKEKNPPDNAKTKKSIFSEEKTEESNELSDNEGPAEPGATLFIKNVSFDSDEASLLKVFSAAGPVKRATIAKKKDVMNPGKFLSMGYGFVEYKKAEFAKEALKTLQHYELDGHKLELKVSHRETLQPKTSRKRQVETAQGDSTKIIVRNIPFQTSKKEIAELFRVFGELKFVRVPKKGGGPGVRGFAFVDFVTKQDAKRAFDSLCHSTHLYGRRLVLEWAKSAETIEDLQSKTAQNFYGGGPTKKKLRKKAIMEALE